MAVYYTLAIDCDQNEAAAASIAARFNDFECCIPVDDSEVVISCTAEAYRCRRCWGKNAPQQPDWMMITVSQPVYRGGPHADLVSAQNLISIRTALYSRLQGGIDRDGTTAWPPAGGFRSAMFGEERQDFLGMYDWPESLERCLSAEKPPQHFEGLIIDESMAINRPIHPHLVPFSPAYLWWDAPIRLRG